MNATTNEVLPPTHLAKWGLLSRSHSSKVDLGQELTSVGLQAHWMGSYLMAAQAALEASEGGS